MKNKKQKLLIIPLLLIIPIITNPLVGITTVYAISEESPIKIDRPDGILANKVQILPFLRNLESANFTNDDVYFKDYSNKGGYQYKIVDDKEFSMSINLNAIKIHLNETIEALKLNRSGMVTGEMIEYFENLYNEVKNHSTIELEHSHELDLNIRTTIDRKVVTILYDPDRSVIEALEKIKTNESVTSQPFTGDEIFTTVILTLARDSVYGLYEVSNNWEYDDGTDASMLKNFVSRINRNMWQIGELRRYQKMREFNVLKAMYGPTFQRSEINEQNPKRSSYGSFSISQLLINELTLKKRGTALIVDKLDYKYIEHNMLGTLIFNDSNENGYMDVGVRTETIGQRNVSTANLGEEALYRLDIKHIENRTYDAPATTDNELSFGLNFDGVHGLLNPVGINKDDSLFNDSTSLAGMHDISEIATTFHFSVNGSATNIKFDYLMGEWSSSEKLEGLSLSQLFSTTVVDKTATRWKRTNNSEVDPVNENASKVSRMRFGSKDVSTFGEISLDSIPYLWDDASNEDAIGQLVPLNLVELTFGRISSDADQVKGIMKQSTKQTFIYSISYTKWDGKSIYHDPSYAAAVGIAAEEPTETGTEVSPTSEAPISGFELISFLLAISIISIPVLKTKRRE